MQVTYEDPAPEASSFVFFFIGGGGFLYYPMLNIRRLKRKRSRNDWKFLMHTLHKPIRQKIPTN